MNLDIRIKSISDIFTCTNMEEAKQFIGKRGYFADCMISFEDLSQRELYNLDRVDDEEIPFATDNVHWRYFLPVDNLKPAEKKYRPFADTKEFFIKTNFEVGDLIHIRSKNNNYEYHLLFIGWTDEGLMLGNFSEMTFDELLDKFELWDGEDNFIPFGVKDE